jgi:hypothetical protein
MQRQTTPSYLDESGSAMALLIVGILAALSELLALAVSDPELPSVIWYSFQALTADVNLYWFGYHFNVRLIHECHADVDALLRTLGSINWKKRAIRALLGFGIAVGAIGIAGGVYAAYAALQNVLDKYYRHQSSDISPITAHPSFPIDKLPLIFRPAEVEIQEFDTPRQDRSKPIVRAPFVDFLTKTAPSSPQGKLTVSPDESEFYGVPPLPPRRPNNFLPSQKRTDNSASILYLGRTKNADTEFLNAENSNSVQFIDDQNP